MAATKTLVFAFDIESAGAFKDLIALGICVMDDHLTVYAKHCWPAYFPGLTEFEPRCQKEFWDHHPDVLELLTYGGPVDPDQCRYDLIHGFWTQLAKWETYAQEFGYQFLLVCDNAVFDAAELNRLTELHMPHRLPMPYMASAPSAYGSLYETRNIQRGLLMAVDPAFRPEWGFAKRLNELYDLPLPAAKADHLPHNDAHVIAHEMQMLIGIQAGIYHRR